MVNRTISIDFLKYKDLISENEDIIKKRGLSYGNSQDAPPLMNGLRKCGIYTQWNFMQP
jgi:hypothetical protein